MVELVGNITNLCKLLNLLVNDTVKPELFRLSKLNKASPEQKLQLKDLCHKLCCSPAKTNSCNRDAFECMESFLCKQRILAAYFVSSTATSRQTLLCLGLLLSERTIESIIDKLLLATPLGEELPSFMIKPETCNVLEAHSQHDEGDSQALLYHSLFLFKNMQYNLRAIANYSQEKVRILSKIHNSAITPGCSNMSAGDLLMRGQPELQLELLSKCQHCTPLLLAYSKWHKKNHIFWEWMVSVVEEEFKTSHTHLTVDKITHLHNFLRKLKRYVYESEQNIEADISATTRRLHPCQEVDNIDSLIENMDLKITNLTKENEEKLYQINKQLNQLQSGKKGSDFNYIIQFLTELDSIK